MLQSKITIHEQCEEPCELTLAKFRDDPTMLIMSKGVCKLTMELDAVQLMQLALFINILLETR